MTYICIILLESITMLLWLHIGFCEKLKIDKKNVGFSIVYTGYFGLATITRAGVWINAISFIVIYCWCLFVFAKNAKSTLARFIISAMGVAASQVISLEILHYIVGQGGNVTSWQNYICANLLSIFLSVFAYVVLVDKVYKVIKIGNSISIVLLYVTVIMVFIKYDYERHNKAYSDMYLYLFGLLLILMLVLIRSMKVAYQLEQNRYELELRNKYEETYSNLILEMRRKQHDYKNQIATLYSMRFLEGISQDKWELQKQYGDQLILSSAVDEVLLNINNPVLSGYFYTVCNQADRLGISIKPVVNIIKEHKRLQLHKIVEMLGILINNSIEYLKDSNIDAKIINVCLVGNEEEFTLEVENTSNYIPYKILEEMFQLGYSSKGDNRGIGLYSLKNIVESYRGELLVENIEKQNLNWFRIKILI